MSLSKLNIVLLLEAKNLLREPKCRKTWVHPFNSERERRRRFENFILKFESTMINSLATIGCLKNLLMYCLKY